MKRGSAVAKGTNRTPPSIRLHLARSGKENLEQAMRQLLGQGVPVKDVTSFAVVAEAEASPTSGQIDPLTKAAGAISAEIHWV
jgi:hypothetical protein